MLTRKDIPKQCRRRVDKELDFVLNTSLGTTNTILPEGQRANITRLRDDAQLKLDAIDSQLLQLVKTLFANLMALRMTHPRPGHLDAEVTRVLEQVIHVEEEHAYLFLRVQRLYIAVAPHNYLPSEILGEVFVHCLDPKKPACHVPFTLLNPSISTPWIISHVCSRWRHIVLADTRLWSSIEFLSITQGSIPLLQEAFTRCKQGKVRLTASEYREPVSRFIETVVLPRSCQIEELSLDLFTPTAGKFCRLPSGLFDSLTTLSLNSENIVDKWRITVLKGAPNLRKVKIGSDANDPRSLPSFPLTLDLPWVQLTHLTFERIPIRLSVLHQTLRQCTNLRKLFVILDKNGRNTDKIISRPPDVIPLPYLQKLDVRLEYQRKVTVYLDFLRPLSLPSLQQFHFVLAEDHQPPDLRAFITCPNCPVPRVALDYWGRPDICHLQNKLNFVVSVHARQAPLSVKTMELIANGDCFPKLVSLRGSVEFEDLECFYNMLKTRWSRISSPQEALAADIFVRGSANAINPTVACLRKIRDLQNELGLTGVRVSLSPTGFFRPDELRLWFDNARGMIIAEDVDAESDDD